MPRAKALDVDPARVVARLPSHYAHIGVYDVRNRKPYAARNDASRPAIDLEHAQLFKSLSPAAGAGDRDAGGYGTLVKDRFVCFWFYPPNTREGHVQGYPIDWSEANLLVRLDPRWSYTRQALLPSHNTAQIDASISQQVGYAAHIMNLYRAHGLGIAVSVHMIGPRTTDSLFYAHRWDPPY